MKAWQQFTHTNMPGRPSGGGSGRNAAPGRPVLSADDIQRYTEGIAPLTEAGRLGAMLFQYPASFVRESENIANLETALGGLAKLAKVVELRHRS